MQQEYIDLAMRASDAIIPNYNNPLVEYEIFLQTLAVTLFGVRDIPSPSQNPAKRNHEMFASDQQELSTANAIESVRTALELEQERPAKRRAKDNGQEQPSSPNLQSIQPRPQPPSPAPVLFSPGTLNPFHSLPAHRSPFNIHVNELLQLYANGALLSDMQSPSAQLIRDLVVGIRRQHSFATAMRSEATLSALLAYMETSPNLPLRYHDERFVRLHISQALSLTNAQLTNPKLPDSDSMIMTVTLLLLIAHRMNDLDTFHAHAQGLVILTNRRRMDRMRLHDSTSSPLPSPDSSKSNRPDWSFEAPPQMFDVNTAHTIPEMIDFSTKRSAFSDLVVKGLVSKEFARTHHYAIIINQLGAHARFDWTLALAIAQHLWTDGGEPRWTTLEMACQTTLRLCMHMNVWPVTDKPCLVTLRRTAVVRMLLRKLNLDLLFFQCPGVLVWICVVLGPLAIGHARTWFAWVLEKARGLSGIQTFTDAISIFEEQYAWSPPMKLASEVFWSAVLFPQAFKGDVPERHHYAHWNLAVKLRSEARIPRLRFTGGPWLKKASEQALREAEDSLLKTLAANSVWQKDADGQDIVSVLMPPWPPCVLNKECPAHGIHVPGSGGFDWARGRHIL